MNRDEQTCLLFEVLRDQAQRLRSKNAASSLALSVVRDALNRGIEIPWGDPKRLTGLAAMLIRNKIIDRHRREDALKRSHQVSDFEVDAIARSMTDEGMRMDVEGALRKLDERSPDDAAVVRLFYCGGFNDQEIATELGISDDRVRRRRINGLVTLRGWLGESGSAGVR